MKPVETQIEKRFHHMENLRLEKPAEDFRAPVWGTKADQLALAVEEKGKLVFGQCPQAQQWQSRPRFVRVNCDSLPHFQKVRVCFACRDHLAHDWQFDRGQKNCDCPNT